MQALHVLRSMYFISSRIGQNSSSQHMFVSLTAVDILAQYPNLVENFLRSIKPAELGQIPAHPLERCLDLYFLNTAELFTIILSPKASEELLLSAAVPYLAVAANQNLLEIFEAAHSVALAVFAIPNNAAISAKHLPFYIDNLFAVCIQAYGYHAHDTNTHRSSLVISLRVNSASPSRPSFRSLLHHHSLPTTNHSCPPSYSRSYTIVD